MKITIDIDPNRLSDYCNGFLATAWHVAQWNPAPIEDQQAGQIAESVGREIIRRWLKAQEPELWIHQGRHHFWQILAAHGHWEDGTWKPDAPAIPAGGTSAQEDHP